MRGYFSVIADRIRSFFPGKTNKQIAFRLVSYFILAITLPFAALIFLVWIGFFGKLPDREELKKIQHPLASEVYSSDSVLLGRYFIQERSFLTSDEIPKSLKKTLVATEDVRFYSHHGIDYKSLGRVLFKTLLMQKESSGGGSTITQQLAKNLYPRRKYRMLSLPINKIREYLIAGRLENAYTKDEILVLYLNTIPFADNTYGIKTAADRFFSVPVKSLTWNQSAVLVGMLKATHTYNPRLFPDRAMERRNVVLQQLAKYGFITAEERRKLQEEPLGLNYNNTTQNTGLAPYFRAYLQQELLDWCSSHHKKEGGDYNLYTDGLKIYTTIDSRMQRYAEQAMQVQMKTLQAKFSTQIGKKQLQKITLSKLKQTPEFKSLRSRGRSEEQAIAELKKPHDTKIFTWEGEQNEMMSVYDSIQHHIAFLQTGIMATHPQSGRILAWVGGIDHTYFKYDHVRESTKRQVGSTFKPVIYAAALESGVGPCDYISGRKTVYTNMDEWTPENSDESTYDKKYSMAGGLLGSVNTVSVKLIEKAGISNAIQTARKMGIESKLPAVPSIALGTPSISVFEMVGAYGVFANNGVYVAPHYLLEIRDQHGEVLERFNQHPKRIKALSPETAQMMVHMMKGVVSEGTGSALRTKYGVTADIAGKTGTTQSNVDGWFIAVSPQVVIGAWVGADDPRMHFRSTALGQGAATALPIVARFYQAAGKDPELAKMIYRHFAPLSPELISRLDCAPSKSNLNILEKIFKKKKKVKVAKFKGKRGKEPS